MGKASREKKLRKLHESSRRTMRERLLNSMPDEKIKIIEDRKGVEKMSEVLARFADPWMDAASSEEQYRLVLGLAVLAWNFALMSEDERSANIDPKVLQELGEPGRELLSSMIDHKLEFYRDYDRPILDYQVSSIGGTLHLDVISAPRDLEGLDATPPP